MQKKLLGGELVMENLQDVTLLYSDMKGFTPLCSEMHPIRLCQLLNDIYSSFDRFLTPFGLYKVDTIGDAFVVVGGMSGYHDRKNHAVNCILFSFHMLECVKKIREKYSVDIQIRIGIHTGACMGSVISVHKPRYLVWGPTSNTANYMESSGIPGAIHISQQTYSKIDSSELNKLGITIEERNCLNSGERTYILRCYDTTRLSSSLFSLIDLFC